MELPPVEILDLANLQLADFLLLAKEMAGVGGDVPKDCSALPFQLRVPLIEVLKYGAILLHDADEVKSLLIQVLLGLLELLF